MSFYIEQGYPAPAVQYYLRGLANGRLAEMPLAEALAAPIRLSECGTAGPLVDTVKLDDISGDYIATLSGEQILAEVGPWAGATIPSLAEILRPNGRWRCAPWPSSGKACPTRARTCASGPTSGAYGFFFPQIFEPVTDPADARFGSLDPDLVRAVADAFAAGYQPPTAGQRAGPGVVRARSASSRPSSGSRPSQKVSSRTRTPIPAPSLDASQVIRVLITGALSAAPTWPRCPARSAPRRSCAASGAVSAA